MAVILTWAQHILEKFQPKATPLEPVDLQVQGQQTIRVVCPNCKGDSCIVRRGAMYHHNVCGHDWLIHKVEAEGGRQNLSWEPERPGLGRDQWPDRWRW
jgi:hypothetical protein